MLKEGRKTKLIPFGREHFPKWIEWQRDPENIEFFRNFNFPLSMDELEEFYRRSVIAQFDKKFFVIYPVRKKAPHELSSEVNPVKEEKPIGMIHLLDLNLQSRKVEIGILMDREYKGKGHAFDALLIIGDYLFNRLNLNKVYIKVMEGNERLIRFCKKGGFEIEGVLKEEVFQDSLFHNQVYLTFFQRRFSDLYKNYFKDPEKNLRKVLKAMKR